MFATFKRSFIFATFAVVSTCALSGPTQVPFKATVTIIDSIVGGAPGISCGPYQAVGTSIGTGNASHLGRITFEAKDCVTIDGAPGLPPIFHFQGTTDSLIITAANGDKIFGTYYGTFAPVPGAAPDKKTGLVPYAMQPGAMFSMTHGTGIFSNAVINAGTLSGNENLNLDPVNNPNASTGTLTLTGNITY
jgi:hypothetical protein